MTAQAIRAKALVKQYGKRRALDGLDLEVPAKKITGLVGPNGAGKTTFMFACAGFLKLSGGKLDLLGDGEFDAEKHSGRVTILPQDSELPLSSTPLELLAHYARLQGLAKAEAFKCAAKELDALHLSDRKNSPVRSLSHGMRRRVALAQCFVGKPELALLDEPLNGLDPREAANARAYIASRSGRQSVLVSSHDLHDLEEMCSHVAFMENGRCVRFAAIETLVQTHSLLRFRLAAKPADFDVLSKACPSCSFAWEDGILLCSFGTGEETIASANRKLLPLLLAQTDVIAVERGETLERAYLHGHSA